MPGHIEEDPEYQAGRAELNQHIRSGNPEWGEFGGDSKPEPGGGCRKAAAVLVGISGVAAAYIGHKYGGAI